MLMSSYYYTCHSKRDKTSAATFSTPGLHTMDNPILPSAPDSEPGEHLDEAAHKCTSKAHDQCIWCTYSHAGTGGTTSGPTSPTPAHVLASMAAMWLVGCNNINQASQPYCMLRSSYLMLHNLTLATGEVSSACRVTALWCSAHATDTVQTCQSMTG